MKKRCAQYALDYIKPHSIIGLGGGSTIAYLVEMIQAKQLDVTIVTPSVTTAKLCQAAELTVVPMSQVDHVTVAFDGCDEVDGHLNALKSGGGIHTKEKVIATMADDYILLVDESKVSDTLSFKVPLVLEVLPQALAKVKADVLRLGYQVTARMSATSDGYTYTENGNLLLEVTIDSGTCEIIAQQFSAIVGIVETSLFYQIATKAIVVTTEGKRIIERSQTK